MNERIAQLYDQAVVFEDNGDFTVPGELDVDKFAELIVKECVSRILRVGILEDIEKESDMIADAVLEHFGV